MDVSGFDWDSGNRTKCENHGVSLREIEDFFAGSIKVLPDKAHSISEQRFQAFGRNEAGRAMLVVFVLRACQSKTLIRPISARYMHRKEVTYYEKEASDLDD